MPPDRHCFVRLTPKKHNHFVIITLDNESADVVGLHYEPRITRKTTPNEPEDAIHVEGETGRNEIGCGGAVN